jgi:hypothetical protein
MEHPLMTRPFTRTLEVVAALLVIANIAYFAATWDSAHLRAILINLLAITAIGVLIIRYLPGFIKDAVRAEFARQRLLDCVENRPDVHAEPDYGDDVIQLDKRRDGSS